MRRWVWVLAVAGAAAVVAAGCVPPSPAVPSVSLEIDGGRAAVNSSDVSLAVTASAGVVEMRVGNGAGPSAVEAQAWQPLLSPVEWSLSSGEGARSVTVQVRTGDGATALATASVVVDTTPPEVAVASHAPGETVDVSNGELVALAGTATDAGSGVEAVDLTTPDGETAAATLQPGDEWATPIGAPESGTFTFGVTARDVAGNSASVSLPLSMLAMQPTDGTVLRPSTLELNAAQTAALVEATEGSLTFAGDLSAALQGVTTIIAGPVSGAAPDGLLRHVISATFDVASSRTTVRTEEGELAEAFAQFEFSTPGAPTGLRMPSSVADPCDAFLEGRSASAALRNSHSFGPNGGSGGSALIFSGTQAVYADVDLKVSVGWAGPDVSGSVAAGSMTCGSLDALATASFDRQLALFSAPLFCGLVGPVPVCVEAEGGLDVNASLSSPTLFAQFHAGAEVRSQIGGDVEVTTPGGFVAGSSPFTGRLAAGAYATLKLVAAKGVESGLLSTSAGPSLSASPGGLEGCIDLSAAFNPSLSLRIGISKHTVGLHLFEESYQLQCRTWSFNSTTDPRPKVQALALNGHHSCALMRDETVKCWGDNWGGQLGNGTRSSSATPVSVLGLSDVVAVAAGYVHNCALVRDGTVACWGKNDWGQLGDGTQADRLTPVTVSGLEGAVALAAGYDSTCALLSNAEVKCWGLNNVGQLGTGDMDISFEPVSVTGLSGATAIAAGWSHTCAALTDGSATCWGIRMGNAAEIDLSLPTTVPGIEGVDSISGGNSFSCATTEVGGATCWGYNAFGQLGNGSTTDSAVPVQVSGLAGAREISAGGHHTCALMTDATVDCWGSNYAGELGTGETELHSVPVSVVGLSAVESMSAGNGHSCAVLAGGSVKCWGMNFAGQLGNGTTSDFSPLPVDVSGF